MTLTGSIKNFFFIILFFIAMSLIPLLMGQIKKLYSRYLDPRAQVGVIHVKGVLYEATPYIKQLQTFFKDDEIKAILLKIECPGSAAGTAQALFHEIRTWKKKYPQKFIATLVENVCASGGYYIASATDSIISTDAALIGSIGARFGYLFQLKDLMENHHIKYQSLKAGEYKGAGDPFTDITSAEKGMLQGVLDDTYHQFARDVAEQRRLSLNALKEWAEGKIFTGQQALKIGLVDYLGSISLAEKIIKERTLIDTDINWIYPPKKGGFMSLFEKDDEQNQLKSTIDTCINYVCNALELRTQQPTSIL